MDKNSPKFIKPVIRVEIIEALDELGYKLDDKTIDFIAYSIYTQNKPKTSA